MDRGAQVDLQNNVRYISELDLYVSTSLYALTKEPEIGDESEY